MLRARLFGAAAILLAGLGWWYNWHLATTKGEFSIKLCIFVSLGLSGGLLMLVRPEWSGPWRKDSPQGQKMALCVVVAFMAVGSGI